MATAANPIIRSSSEFAAVLERARTEGWQELALIGPSEFQESKPPTGRTFHLRVPLGDDDARSLAALTGLTSLTLCDNHLGADGVRALAGLTGLTSLNLNFNHLGADGARVLAGLTGLTSLALRGNYLGADGARALAGAHPPDLPRPALQPARGRRRARAPRCLVRRIKAVNTLAL